MREKVFIMIISFMLLTLISTFSFESKTAKAEKSFHPFLLCCKEKYEIFLNNLDNAFIRGNSIYGINNIYYMTLNKNTTTNVANLSEPDVTNFNPFNSTSDEVKEGGKITKKDNVTIIQQGTRSGFNDTTNELAKENTAIDKNLTNRAPVMEFEP